MRRGRRRRRADAVRRERRQHGHPQGPKGDTGAPGVVGTIVVRTKSVTIVAGAVGTVSAGAAEYEHVIAAGADWKLAKGETGAGLSTVSLSRPGTSTA
jgi:hypothetical protein